MSEETKAEDVVAQVVETLQKCRGEGRRGLAVIRCGATNEVDHCRESLRNTKTSFGWKSQPVAETFVRMFEQPQRAWDMLSSPANTSAFLQSHGWQGMPVAA